MPNSDLIPPGTIATLSMHIDATGVDEESTLTRSKDGSREYLDAKFTVADGPCKGRKLSSRLTLVR